MSVHAAGKSIQYVEYVNICHSMSRCRTDRAADHHGWITMLTCGENIYTVIKVKTHLDFQLIAQRTRNNMIQEIEHSRNKGYSAAQSQGYVL